MSCLVNFHVTLLSVVNFHVTLLSVVNFHVTLLSVVNFHVTLLSVVQKTDSDGSSNETPVAMVKHLKLFM